MRYHSSDDIQDFVFSLSPLGLQVELLAILKTLFDYYYESASEQSTGEEAYLFFMSLYHFYDKEIYRRREMND